MFKGISAIEFCKRFPDNEACYRYLIKLKWGNGFFCKRCQGRHCSIGRTYYYRRCTSCKYDESVTAHTVLHGLKMPMLKIFHILFRLSTKKKGMSSVELGKEVQIQQKTAWFFKLKIQLTMQLRNNKPLVNHVVVDETLVGGHVKGSYGRVHATKSVVFTAIEKLPDDRTGNISFTHINNFQVISVRPVIDRVVDAEAIIYADNFPSYRSIRNSRGRMEIVQSKGSTFFEEIHKQIMTFKMWLSGIHHKCSKTYLNNYANEYVYRFNRRNQRKWIFHNLMSEMIKIKPHIIHLQGTCEQIT